MIVDTGYLAAMEETCTMDIVKVEGMKKYVPLVVKDYLIL